MPETKETVRILEVGCFRPEEPNFSCSPLVICSCNAK